MIKFQKILDYRERLKRNGQLTPKQEQDFLKDKIFRLAIRQQIKVYQARTFDNNTVSLLDRTPLMSWAYVSSANPNNPYLNEILEEGLFLTDKLTIDKIFLLDIDPVTAYSRIICRSLKGVEPLEEQIINLTKLISAPENIKQSIIQKSLWYLKSGIAFQKKNFRIWDFMTYEEIERQTRTYFEAVKIAADRIGVKITIIDARQPIEQVLESVKGNMIWLNY